MAMEERGLPSATNVLWLGILRRYPHPETYKCFSTGPSKDFDVPLGTTDEDFRTTCVSAIDMVLGCWCRAVKDFAKYGFQRNHFKLASANTPLDAQVFDKGMKPISTKMLLGNIQCGREPEDPLRIQLADLVLEDWFKTCVPRRLVFGKRCGKSHTFIRSIVPIENVGFWSTFRDEVMGFNVCSDKNFKFVRFPAPQDVSGVSKEPLTSEFQTSLYLSSTVLQEVENICNGLGKEFGYAVKIALSDEYYSTADFVTIVTKDSKVTTVGVGQNKFPNSLAAGWRKAIKAIKSGNRADKDIWAYAQTFHGMIEKGATYGFLTNSEEYIFMKRVLHYDSEPAPILNEDSHATSDVDEPEESATVAEEVESESLSDCREGELLISEPLSQDDPDLPVMKALCYVTHRACSAKGPLRKRIRKKPVKTKTQRAKGSIEDARRSNRISGAKRVNYAEARPYACRRKGEHEEQNDKSSVTCLISDSSSSDSAWSLGREEMIDVSQLSGMWRNLVAEGSGGRVYRARIRGEDCAVKICSLGNEEGIRMMKNEAEMYLRLKRF